ncbi:MAG: Sec-independent protein translocase protein TatB [Betaproteobacteria bacterium]
MFNFGLSEIMVIAVVGLIVIGPERLPKVAKTVGHLFGRMQRYASQVKAEIDREVQLDELKNLQKTMKEAADEIEADVSSQFNFIQSEIDEADKELSDSVENAKSNLNDDAPNQIAVKKLDSQKVATSELGDEGATIDSIELGDEGATIDSIERIDEKAKDTEPQNGINLMAGMSFVKEPNGSSDPSETIDGSVKKDGQKEVKS